MTTSLSKQEEEILLELSRIYSLNEYRYSDLAESRRQELERKLNEFSQRKNKTENP